MRPLYVRLPEDTADKLARAAVELPHPEAESRRPPRGEPPHRRQARVLPESRRGGPHCRGSRRTAPHDAATVISMAEEGTLPGRKVGDDWRFARAALLQLAQRRGTTRRNRPHAHGPDGRRAGLARRTLIRHLLAPAARTHHLHRHADRRPDREPRRRAADPPRVRRPGQGHRDLHQLPGRLRSTPASRSTTRCSSSSQTCRPSASASRCRWARCCWPAARTASATRCRTAAS